MKYCTKCSEDKPISSFSKNRTHKDGLQYYCKACMAVATKRWGETNPSRRAESQQRFIDNNPNYVQRWARANPEKVSSIHRRWRKKNPEGLAKHKKLDRIKHPDEYKARSVVNNAIKKGSLIRPEKCQYSSQSCKGIIEAHHSDYNKPLVVKWLCVAHHKAWHRMFKAVDKEEG